MYYERIFPLLNNFENLKELSMQLNPQGVKHALYEASGLEFVEHIEIYVEITGLLGLLSDLNIRVSEATLSTIDEHFFPNSMKKIEKVTFVNFVVPFRDRFQFTERIERVSSSIRTSYELEFRKYFFENPNP